MTEALPSTCCELGKCLVVTSPGEFSTLLPTEIVRIQTTEILRMFFQILMKPEKESNIKP